MRAVWIALERVAVAFDRAATHWLDTAVLEQKLGENAAPEAFIQAGLAHLMKARTTFTVGVRVPPLVSIRQRTPGKWSTAAMKSRRTRSSACVNFGNVSVRPPPVRK